MQAVLKTLIKSRRQLILYAREPNNDATGDSEWLKDNIMLLTSSINGGIRHIKRHKNADFGNIFDICLRFAESSKSPIFGTLTAYFGAKKLNITESGAALSLLYAAYAVYLSQNFGNGTSAQKSVRALNALKSCDESSLINEISPAEKLLCLDPAGVYADMSEGTKERYRESVVKTAKKLNTDECEYIESVLSLAEKMPEGKNHIGFELIKPFYGDAQSRFLCALKPALAVIIAAAAGIISRNAFSESFMPVIVSLLVFLPVNEALTPISDALTSKIYRHRFLPEMDSEKDIAFPSTVITVSSLLPPSGKAQDMKQHLKMLKMSDSLPNTKVLVLLDLKNSKMPVLAEDETDINAFKRVIDELNEETGGFVMAVRERVYSVTEEEYTGYERKRGAIREAARFLRGEGEFFVLHGDKKGLTDAKYMLCLDSDTNIPFEMLRKLTAAACHPLNVPEIENGAVKKGFGIIMPRIETSVASSGKTLFSRIFTTGGTASYSAEISEKNMDMYGETVFTGKGLIDIDAYNETCGEAFAPGRVLSHDILEGGLLRTAFMGSAVLTDNFPSRPESYYKRESRWVRGDIQNLIYAVKPLKKGGALLPRFTRLRILRNAAACITPIMGFICLILSFFVRAQASCILLFAAVWLSVSAPGVSLMSAVVNEGAAGFTRMFFSSDEGVIVRSFLRAVFNLGSLPFNACVNADAVIRAFYRMLISKKKTLEWTTAAQSEHSGGSKAGAVIVPLITGALLILGNPAQIITGIIILSVIPFSLGRGIELKKYAQNSLSEKERSIVLSYAASMWSFFEENVNAYSNHLPPDNIQETPVKRTAARTSPTNIGLYLVSVLGACDLSFISPEQMYQRLISCINTIKALPKYSGMLYNWYDTKTLKPLSPGFISSVDCGNYLCSLISLKEGLKSYAVSLSKLNEIIEFCEEEIADNNILTMYSPKRKLFSIGIDTAENRLSDSYYDLYMSEARMLSYFVTAKRLVPVSHWGMLSRPAVKAGLYSAIASWSGTMFEYFMPSLFLPVYENTLQSEALRVCLYEQKKLSKRDIMPYGVSECGFYAFDAELNYRYKANGVKSLSIKRNASADPVFAPYAAFLTLPFDKAGALKNLSRFAYLHATGRYGFYEAVDFTPSHIGNEDYMPVRSFMAHHVGMSFISAVNCLTNFVFVKRFMSDVSMLSAKSLLEEKIPSDTPVKNIVKSDEKKPALQKPQTEKDSFESSDFSLYSDREATLLCAVNGSNRFLYSGLNMLYSNGVLNGMFAAVLFEGNVYPLNFTKGTLTKTCYYCENIIGQLSVQFACALPGGAPAAAYPVKIKNNGKKSVNVSILYCFSPSMEQVFSPSQHKAFTDMFISADYSPRRAALYFERKEQGSEVAGIASGFSDLSPFVFCYGRDKIFPHAINQKHAFEKHLPKFDCSLSSVMPCAALKLDITLTAGQKTEKVLLLCAGADKKDASYRLDLMRSRRLPDIRKAVRNPFAVSGVSAAVSQEFAAVTLFGARKNSEIINKKNENNRGIDALWQAGISGDLPIITAVNDLLPQGYINELVNIHKTLAISGMANDLVFISTGASDYMQTANEPIQNALKNCGIEDSLGKRGGVHILSRQANAGSVNAVQAFSAVLLPSDGENTFVADEKNEEILSSLPLTKGENTFLPGGYFIGVTPERAWCLTLSNSSFGTLLCDNSLGFSWAINSRLNKLTPDAGEPTSPPNGEMLIIETENKLYNCIDGASVYYYTDKAVYKSLCGNVKITVTVEVPQKGMFKRITVKTSGGASKISYRVKPLMCEDKKFSFFVRVEETENGILLSNPVNTDYSGYLHIYAQNSSCSFNDGTAEVSVCASADGGASSDGGASADGGSSSDGGASAVFYMAFARTKAAAVKSHTLPFTAKNEQAITSYGASTPAGLMLSSLLLHTVIDTRFLARCGYYQCSGAYGFRDQLQDAMNFVRYYPKITKQHILRCACAQFYEGDVMHWFHVPPDNNDGFSGVRTRCSDDMLWLPAAVTEYIKATGDYGILGINVPFREGEELREGENERYKKYRKSKKTATLYNHCIKAIKRAADYGKNGLPLIKGGDWNDSFGEVGIGGRGESVWLAMFLRMVCLSFSQLCRKTGDTENALFTERTAQAMANAVMTSCRAGDRYLRGFYDDGTPLGAPGSDACQIDILPQAFASFCEMPCDGFTKKALITALKLLTDAEHGYIKLFTPPFSDKTKRAGYVNDYPEGIRENGGQYTHAAIWLIMALKKEGLTNAAEALTEMILPAAKYERGDASVYDAEPYSLCGDVYSAQGLEGVGGWSLYTGSAGWLLRLLTDDK